MKKKEFKDLKNKEMPELKGMLQSALSRRKGLQFDLALGKVKNQKELREVKKTIAQIKTVIAGMSSGIK